MSTVVSAPVSAGSTQPPLADKADHRLRKHADYQRVYREGRKQFSVSMSYFYALRATDADAVDASKAASGPRVGLTAGKVLGKAVERNRIKRRLRDIVRRHVSAVGADVDIVLHPRRIVLTMEFAKLESEVVRIFSIVHAAIERGGGAAAPSAGRRSRPRNAKASS